MRSFRGFPADSKLLRCYWSGLISGFRDNYTLMIPIGYLACGTAADGPKLLVSDNDERLLVLALGVGLEDLMDWPEMKRRD
ncbi:hypothetical protein A5697_23995 [Mycobacterium sp. E3251]|nr:hypothetical protein A5697_23995 [Mycobacterium sp. E3251]